MAAKYWLNTQDYNEMIEQRNQEQKEIEAADKKVEGMLIYLKRQLAEMGISKAGIDALARAFETFSYDESNYQFTGNRKEKVGDLWNRFYKAS